MTTCSKGSKRGLVLACGLFAALAVDSATADASEVGETRRFGLGGMIGAPTGLSMKLYLTERHALDFGVGIGFLGDYSGSFHIDYLVHFMLTRARPFDLPLYVGVGGQVQAFFRDDFHSFYGGDASNGRIGVAVRVPVGIAFNLNRTPIDIFIELVPGLGFIPGHDVFGNPTLAPGLFVEGAVGCRYYFGGSSRR